jgi:hypothetical protein
VRVYEGDDIDSENKIATQSRILSNSEEVRSTVESIRHLGREKQNYVQIAKCETGMDSKYNIVSQVCALSFISMSYQPEIIRAKEDQKASALLGRFYEIAPELVEYFLLLVLTESRFTS